MESPLFSFLNLARVSEPTLFCFLNLASKQESPKPLRVRVRVYVHTEPTRRRHQKTANKGAVALFRPYKAVVSHFTGAIDRIYIKRFFVSYKGVYGRGRERGQAPHTPPRYQRDRQGVHFQPPYIANIVQCV